MPPRAIATPLKRLFRLVVQTPRPRPPHEKRRKRPCSKRKKKKGETAASRKAPGQRRESKQNPTRKKKQRARSKHVRQKPGQIKAHASESDRNAVRRLFRLVVQTPRPRPPHEKRRKRPCSETQEGERGKRRLAESPRTTTRIKTKPDKEEKQRARSKHVRQKPGQIKAHASKSDRNAVRHLFLLVVQTPRPRPPHEKRRKRPCSKRKKEKGENAASRKAPGQRRESKQNPTRKKNKGRAQSMSDKNLDG